ncbi:putative poly(beta-D-mannuronate) O-acetylase (Alginate biosynthesis protein algI) [Plesiocystis pacifica SIR-1]|uniref:Putative poly(Beta-D-mannuronate) O-acetylase (Alginate biosynthesis protein algI) n=1 Tax=Plesiocystis pacifica SIR-1 TaxID=391625 RepID=A6GAN5_9BACT|nr:MBOAT family O-acyltransferase [Plesiocystis pacifica]EDM77097.1 putative poly(beta-D-mannuronate) O-acetylase (Alginate biosynthesis protein algI) [Plesiocystis pacifica SIR-1]
MLFPTFDFLLFLIPILVGFWLLADKPVARGLWLLVGSYFFYMAGPKTEPPPAPAYFAGLLLFSTILDFVAGKQIWALEDDYDSEDDEVHYRAKRIRKFWLTLSLVGNLGLLLYFKYVNFFIEAFTDMAGLAGWSVDPLHLDVVLPLGISFYTFQSLSYTLDIERGNLEPEPKFWRFALFVVFFPQLVAGPIVRAKDLLPQLREGPRFSAERIEEGAFRVVKGLAKKVVLGDWIAVHLTDKIFDAPGTFTSAELMLALYAYTLQIYADFSGYTDIAIGVGRMLGFDLPENFRRPYQAKDIGEYWRRWHMTLSGWLRDYLFFPLVARLGAKAGYIATWITMFLVGMWHGASWNFVIYANIHAGAMVFSRWNRVRKGERPMWVKALAWPLGTAALAAGVAAVCHYVLHVPRMESGAMGGLCAVFFVLICVLPRHDDVVADHGQGWLAKLAGAAHILLTFHFVIVSRIFFRSPDLETSRAFLAGLLEFDLSKGIRPGLVTPWIAAALIFGLVYHFTPEEWVTVHAKNLFRKVPGPVLGVIFLAFILGLMLLMEGSPRAFIYFQF